MKRFNLPDPGEGLVEAEIVTWKVKVGDEVKVNDIVVEVETAKSLVELPIPWAGKVAEILVEEGTTVDVGAPIVVIDDGSGEPASDDSGDAAGAAEESGEAKREPVLVGYGALPGGTKRRARKGAPGAQAAMGDAGQASSAPAAAAASSTTAHTPSQAPAAPAGPPKDAATRPLAKPPVRKLAKDNGIDLATITGSGKDGIVTRADVEAAIAGGGSAAAPTGGESGGYTAPTFSRSGERETRTPVKGVRKMTAQAMSSSAFTAPHVTEFITVDVTATMELVEKLKADKAFKDVRISPLLILAKAMCIAVKRNPGVIAVWDEQAQEIVQKNYLNLGIAAATPRGLIVPNIKDADLMDLRQLADALGNLVSTARAGKTQPAEMSGGCITITNVGVFGVDTGTPIINPGESAIVAFGAVRKQPWVVTNAAGEDEIVPRWITQLAVSFDHRLIDGELGSKFLADLAALMEDPSKAFVWG